VPIDQQQSARSLFAPPGYRLSSGQQLVEYRVILSKQEIGRAPDAGA
jgi:hypothetical protein